MQLKLIYDYIFDMNVEEYIKTGKDNPICFPKEQVEEFGRLLMTLDYNHVKFRTADFPAYNPSTPPYNITLELEGDEETIRKCFSIGKTDIENDAEWEEIKSISEFELAREEYCVNY